MTVNMFKLSDTGYMSIDTIQVFVNIWLVGWSEFNVPFQHKFGYIRDEFVNIQLIYC